MAPVAVDDSAYLVEDGAPVVINVVANDSDADVGDVLSVANLGSLSDPALGSLQNLGNGQIKFTPSANVSGTSTFTYQLDDGEALSNTATVTIDVAPDADLPALVFNMGPTGSGSAFALSSTTAAVQSDVQLAALGNGRFVAAWESSGQDGSGLGIYARLFDESGNPLGGEFRVNSTTAGDQANPSLAALDGSFIVAWDGNGAGDAAGIFTRRYDLNGNALDATEVRANAAAAGTQRDADVAASGNGYSIAWTSQVAGTASALVSNVDSGWYAGNGTHSSSNTNYIVGYENNYRAFFGFDVTGLQGRVQSASLQLFTYDVSSPQGSETIQLFDVTTAASTVFAGGTNAAVWNDLGSGTLYGSATVSGSQDNTLINVSLNSNAVSAINASGQYFLIGVSNATQNANSAGEYLFGFSGFTSSNALQLTVTTTVDGVVARRFDPAGSPVAAETALSTTPFNGLSDASIVGKADGVLLSPGTPQCPVSVTTFSRAA